MNFARDCVDAADPASTALIERNREGSRRIWTFGDVAAASAGMAGSLASRGVQRGDVVMTLIGNRPEWVLTMVACFRIGAVVLPCTEQLRPHDLRLRIETAKPRVIVSDERNRHLLEPALNGRRDIHVLEVPDDTLLQHPGAPPVELNPAEPCLLSFTSGTSGEPKAVVHAQRYLIGQRLQAEHWLAPRAGDVVWCTAASGWSKSARNVFVAPWICGAAGLVHDARFEPAERLQILSEEHVNVLCMSPTEYRAIAKRVTLSPLPSVNGLVAAGEALDRDALEAWREATGLDIRDGFGQTETGQLTANPPGERARPGSMGLPLPGVSIRIDDGELVVDPATVPTFFTGYLGDTPHDRRQPWRTGDRASQDESGYLFFEGRTDDVVISSGYRIGPFEVESALLSHPAVAEAAVVAAPDETRGSVVRALIVLTDGERGDAGLVARLQEHVKQQTAPYKYPRIVEFRDDLPKTSSGKVRRALLRDELADGMSERSDAPTQT